MTAEVSLQLSRMTRSRFEARPPPIAHVQLAEAWEGPAGTSGLSLKSVTERNDSYMITVSYSSDDLGERPPQHNVISALTCEGNLCTRVGCLSASVP